MHIRALLDEHGIAGARVDFRTRFTTWADSKLATLTSLDNQLVMRSYIQWHLSRRFDDNCTNGTFLAAKQGVVKSFGVVYGLILRSGVSV
ncbi:hypothetical protein QSJ19_26440, partial [Gordonia sp. ABSL11-1]|nr:hypothetical protein [Gordonia sp. ABSL11-1]